MRWCAPRPALLWASRLPQAAPAGLTQRAKEAASAVADKAGAYVQVPACLLAGW